MTVITKKAALVTGGTAGVGRTIALELAAQGWDVAIQYFRRKDDADAVVAAIRRDGGRAEAFQANMTREDEVGDLVPAAQAKVGALTLLVNAAVEFGRDTVATAARESWDRHIETNLRAPLVLTGHFVRQLPQGETGNVINVVDQVPPDLAAGCVSFAVSQAGLAELTRSLAVGLAPTVRVNGISPGIGGAFGVGDGPTAMAPDSERRNASPRQESIGRAVRFILETPSITGQTIVLVAGDRFG